MVHHYFLDKTNTIFKGSVFNTGLNPILKLNYGSDISRGLIHFDISEIEKEYKGKNIDFESTKFILKMKNCGSIGDYPIEFPLLATGKSIGRRASSFDLLLLPLPQAFDGGRGYNPYFSLWEQSHGSFNANPSNWYFAKNGYVWESDRYSFDMEDPELNWETIIKDKGLKGGVYLQEKILEEFNKFENGEESIVITKQHFDIGDEDLSMDITEYIKKVILDKYIENFGLMLMFSPIVEGMNKPNNEYVGFFTDHTNSFFHPFVEVISNNHIDDNRNGFCLGKPNNLYFYSEINGESVNLDELPICEIEGVTYEVKQAQKGAYFAHIEALPDNIEEDTILIDKWSNILVNGQKYDDVEMEFVVQPKATKVHLGKSSYTRDNVIPILYGIEEGERIRRNEIRAVYVEYPIKYSDTDSILGFGKGEYKLYIKENDKEFTVIDWQPIEKTDTTNFFKIFSNELIPHKYCIDIRINDGQNIKHFKEALGFEVISEIK